jgi:hypothetical protein
MKRMKTLFTSLIAAVAILALGAPVQLEAGGCYVSVPRACTTQPIPVVMCGGVQKYAYCTPLTTNMGAVGGYQSGHLSFTSWTITCYFTCWFYDCADEYDTIPYEYDAPASGAIGGNCTNGGSGS